MVNNDNTEVEILTWFVTITTIEGRVSEGDTLITSAEEESRVKEVENVVKNKEREEVLQFERVQLRASRNLNLRRR